MSPIFFKTTLEFCHNFQAGAAQKEFLFSNEECMAEFSLSKLYLIFTLTPA